MARLIYAYNQAPWRTQRQMFASALIGILIVAMVAAVYLTVTARATIVGREVLLLREEIVANQRINEDLQTELAFLLSTSELDRRAQALGYRPARPDEVVYVLVADYAPAAVQRTALAPVPAASSAAVETPLPAEYTMSLLDWFDQRMSFNLGASR